MYSTREGVASGPPHHRQKSQPSRIIPVHLKSYFLYTAYEYCSSCPVLKSRCFVGRFSDVDRIQSQMVATEQRQWQRDVWLGNIQSGCPLKRMLIAKFLRLRDHLMILNMPNKISKLILASQDSRNGMRCILVLYNLFFKVSVNHMDTDCVKRGWWWATTFWFGRLLFNAAALAKRTVDEFMGNSKKIWGILKIVGYNYSRWHWRLYKVSNHFHLKDSDEKGHVIGVGHGRNDAENAVKKESMQMKWRKSLSCESGLALTSSTMSWQQVKLAPKTTSMGNTNPDTRSIRMGSYD